MNPPPEAAWALLARALVYLCESPGERIPRSLADLADLLDTDEETLVEVYESCNETL